MLRTAQFSGSFYPGLPATLSTTLLHLCPVRSDPQTVLGVMAPHAGYIYSGRFAGQVFGAIEVPDLVILLGPNHTGMGAPGSVYTHGDWETPIGSVPVDNHLARALLDASPYLVADTLAHSQEHSLEVQLPFLLHRNHQVKIVPICFGRQPLDHLLSIGAAIAKVIARWPKPVLLVGSSDMTHFKSASQAAPQDHLALENIASVDAAGLYKTVTTGQISMCGVLPMTVLLAAVHALGARHGKIVAYGHSGEVTGDDRDVVAYAGAIIPLPTI
jgi:AmmeMemoRadiSam system protein B